MGQDFCLGIKEPKTLNKKILEEQTVLAVDLGINNAYACAVMKTDGTVLGREMFRMPGEEDCLKHRLNKVRKEMKQGHYHTPALWATITNVNREIAVGTARFIVETAEKYKADMIVFEQLDTGGKKIGKSRRQRLHMWKCRDIQGMVACKAYGDTSDACMRMEHITAGI